MKIFAAFGLILFLATASFGQAPNIDSIRVRAQQPEYKLLLQRFQNADTSLSKIDLQVIYYGFAFQKEFVPSRLIVLENRIRELNNNGKPVEAIRLADSVLAFYPVSMVALFEKSYASGLMDYRTEEKKSNRLYHALLKTILNSGDGLSFETAYHLISPNEEFEVIRYFDLTAFNYTGIDYNGSFYEVLELKKNKLKISKVYFDINLSKMKQEDILPDLSK